MYTVRKTTEWAEFCLLLDYYAVQGSFKPKVIGAIFKDQVVQEGQLDLTDRTASPETSVPNHLTPRNNPEDEIIQFNRGRNLRSCIGMD